MIKVLVTGAAGTVGIQTIKYLLSEGKYEITALDLKNSKSYNELKKYKKRMNIIYGDVCDRVLIEALVKDHDYIIHLASVLPPLANMKKNLTKLIEYDALENIVRSINYYNPNLHLIYSSATSLYKDQVNCTVKTKVKTSKNEYYTYYKAKSEELIKEKLKKYTIARLPLVISSNPKSPIIYNTNTNNEIDVITNIDAGYAFAKIVSNSDKLNKKIINLSSENSFSMKFNDLMKKIIQSRGLSYKYVLSKIFMAKNYYSNKCTDTINYEEILNYRMDTLEKFMQRSYYEGKSKMVSKLIGKIYNKIWGRK